MGITDSRMRASDRAIAMCERNDDDTSAQAPIAADAQHRFAALLNGTDPAERRDDARTVPLAHSSAMRYGADRPGWLGAPVLQTPPLCLAAGALTVRLTNGPFAGIEVTAWREGPNVRARIKSAPDSRLGALVRARAALAETLCAELGFPVTVELDHDAATAA